MSRFLIATLDVRLAEMGRFVDTMGLMRAILADAGWSLVGSYSLRTGLMGRVVNVWEISGFDQVDAGFAALSQAPDWPRIQAALAEAVIRETVAFADALPYPIPA